MGTLKSSPRNGALGYISDLIRSGRDKANEYQVLPQVPLIGGTGLGDLFIGKTPEELNEWSYGNNPFQVVGGGTGSYVPQVKAGRQQQLADTVLTGADVGALAKVGKHLGKTALENAFTGHPSGSPLAQLGAIDQNKRNFLRSLGKLNQPENPVRDIAPSPVPKEEGVNQGRRSVLKGLGVGALTAAAPGIALKAAKSLPDNIVVRTVDEVAPTAGKAAAHVVDNLISSVFRPDETASTLGNIIRWNGGDFNESLAKYATNSKQLVADFGHAMDGMDSDLFTKLLMSPVNGGDGVSREAVSEILKEVDQKKLRRMLDKDLNKALYSDKLSDLQSRYSTTDVFAAAYPELAEKIDKVDLILSHLHRETPDTEYVKLMKERYGGAHNHAPVGDADDMLKKFDEYDNPHEYDEYDEYDY